MDILLVLVSAVVVGILIALMLEQTEQGEPAGIESKGTLFTPEERFFLGRLEQVVENRYRVMAKVRLGALVMPAKGFTLGQRATAQNRINQKQLDFVIFTATEFMPVAVVQLDYPSQQCLNRDGYNRFVDQALASACIPVLRFPAGKGYTLQDLRARVSELLPDVPGQYVESVVAPPIAKIDSILTAILESNPAPTDTIAPVCPECAAVMVKRQAKQEQNSGKYFWACSTFPRCRQLEASEEG